MTKKQFLDSLERALSDIPEKERKESLDFYSEMIDDKIEGGMSEGEAVSALGSPADIAKEIMLDMPLPKIIKTKCKAKKTWSALEIILLVLGFPLWFPLLVAGGAILLSLYIVLWALIISLWAVVISFFAAALCCIAVFVAVLIKTPVYSLLCLGAGMFFAGLTLLTLYAAIKVTVIIAKVSGRLCASTARKIKSKIIK